MKKLLMIALAIAAISSCSNPWEYTDRFYIPFEEATAHIIDEYGDRPLIRATVFYDNDNRLYTEDYDSIDALKLEERRIRNVVVYWDIEGPEGNGEPYDVTISYGSGYEYTYTKYYTTYSIEAWNQNDSSMDALKKYGYYGWSVLRESKGNYDYIR